MTEHTPADAAPELVKALNTICPVCGMAASLSIPPISLIPKYQHHQEQDKPLSGVAFCCLRCIEVARNDPDRYLIAARNNSAAESRPPDSG